jgi:hypothetical protein
MEVDVEKTAMRARLCSTRYEISTKQAINNTLIELKMMQNDEPDQQSNSQPWYCNPVESYRGHIQHHQAVECAYPSRRATNPQPRTLIHGMKSPRILNGPRTLIYHGTKSPRILNGPPPRPRPPGTKSPRILNGPRTLIYRGTKLPQILNGPPPRPRPPGTKSPQILNGPSSSLEQPPTQPDKTIQRQDLIQQVEEIYELEPLTLAQDRDNFCIPLNARLTHNTNQLHNYVQSQGYIVRASVREAANLAARTFQPIRNFFTPL